MVRPLPLPLLVAVGLAASCSTPNRAVPRSAPGARRDPSPAPAAEADSAGRDRLAVASDGESARRPLPSEGGSSAPLHQDPPAAVPPQAGDPAAASPPSQDPPASRPPAPDHDVVAVVAGRPIHAGELLAAWMHRDSAGLRATLEELILSRLVLTESARAGIELDPERLERAQRRVRERLEDEVEKSGSGLETNEFIRRRLGLDPETYLDRLARETAIDLLAERVVRSWVLGSDRTEVRVIVVDERGKRDEVERRLAQGESFPALAEELSIEKGAGDGGRIPPVVRGESALARLAFSTPVGQVGGPVFEDDRWLFLYVDARPTPLQGAWSEIGPTVESSLADQGIQDPEYWQWKADVLKRFEVDMEPLLQLVRTREQ